MVSPRDEYAKGEMSTSGHLDQGMSAPEDLGDPVKLDACEKRRKGGGWVTTPFIFGCEASEALAGFGARANLITFLTAVMHMKNLNAATLLNSLASLTTVAGLLGAFLADAYLGRFTTIALGSFINLSGMFILTAIALDKTLHPATCTISKSNHARSCQKASSLQMGILYFAFALMAIGSGSLRPCVAPFGASQFDQAHPEERKQLQHYFNWYYFAVTIAALLATTIVVYVQDNVGWGLGFGIPASVFLISIIFFLGGIRLYRYSPPRGSPFTRMAQVVVAAIRKMDLKVPDNPAKLYHGAVDNVDESEELETPSSSTDEKGGASSEKSRKSLTDARFIIYCKRNLGERSAGASDENNCTEQMKVEVEKNEDVSHEEKPAENVDGRQKFANVSDEMGHAADLPLEKTRADIVVGPHRTAEGEDNVVVLRHSDQFRFLDKAAVEVPQDWQSITGKDGQILKTKIYPWKLCPVQQVEELKCMVRLVPMWVTVIPLAMAVAQGHTYAIQQAATMDRRLGNFVIPAASLSTISSITVLIWLPFYDKKAVPILRKYTGIDRGMSFLEKIGLGIVLVILAELVRTLVEHKRREAAKHSGLVDRPFETIPFSAFWLVPQFVLGGLSESFMIVGHLEFFYHMLPEHMTSTGSALFMIATAIGTSLSTVSLNIIQKLTARHGHPGWLDNNINKAHLDYFYGLLTISIALDFALFLAVARWYKRKRHLNQMTLESS